MGDGPGETNEHAYIYGPKGEILSPRPAPTMAITAKREGVLARVWRAIRGA